MENQKPSSKQIMLNYGLMLGIVSIIIAVANYAVGDVYKPHWLISVLGILALALFIVYGIKKVKEGHGGFLKLGEALKVGLGIALISGIVYVIYIFVFANYIEPDFFENMAKVQEQNVIDKYPNMSDEQLEGAVAMTKKMTGPAITSAFILIFSLFFGFIVALIAGLIMKRSDEEVTSI